jgi:PRTRC genetic system protein E
MIVSADEKTGRLTVSVLPKPKKDMGEPALVKDLTLTATPEEFDAGFVEALRGYREKRQSLTEQAEATNEVLEAAKSASAKKAAEAMTKAAKLAQTAKASPAPETKATTNDEGEGGGRSGDQAVSPPTATPGEPLALFG